MKQINEYDMIPMNHRVSAIVNELVSEHCDALYHKMYHDVKIGSPEFKQMSDDFCKLAELRNHLKYVLLH